MPRRLLILFIVFWGVMVIRLDSTWDGIQERVWIAAAVRNYTLYDFQDIGFMVTRNAAPTNPDNLSFYTSHPPLNVWLPAILTKFFGYNELAIRYGFAAVTMLSAAAMYVIARRLYGERIAFWATLFYVVTPFVAYFGRMPGHDLLGMLAALLYTAVIINWLRKPTQVRFIALIALTWLAVWTAWPAVFFIAVIGIVAMWQGKAYHKKRVVILGISTILAFVTLLVFYQLQWDGSLERLLDKYEYRTSNVSGRQGSEPFTIIEYIMQNVGHVIYLGTPGLLALSVWGIFILRKRGGNHAILIGLFIAGLLYQLAFRNASFIHSYYKVFLVPAMALSAAFVVVYSRRGRWKRPAVDGLIFSMIIVSASLIFIMHLGDSQPWIFDIVNEFEAESTPDDILATSFYDTKHNEVIMFYLFRQVQWIQTPEEALELANETQQRVMYVYCVDIPVTERVPIFPNIFDDMASYESEAFLEDRCHLFKVTPDEIQ